MLVVDDEASVRSLAREFLENNGYAVLEAKDGAEAILESLWHRGEIHLLLADLVLPQMNGRELARRLARHYPNLAVPYMSDPTDERLDDEVLETPARM